MNILACSCSTAVQWFFSGTVLLDPYNLFGRLQISFFTSHLSHHLPRVLNCFRVKLDGLTDSLTSYCLITILEGFPVIFLLLHSWRFWVIPNGIYQINYIQSCLLNKDLLQLRSTNQPGHLSFTPLSQEVSEMSEKLIFVFLSLLYLTHSSISGCFHDLQDPLGFGFSIEMSRRLLVLQNRVLFLNRLSRRPSTPVWVL